MAEKKVSSLIESDNFKNGMEIVNEYVTYLVKQFIAIDDKIAGLTEKCKSNVLTSQEILKDFNIVRFVEKDRQLYIEPVENEDDIRFKVDTLINRRDERPILRMLQKRVDAYRIELEEAEQKRDNQQLLIDNLELPKAKKKWGIFTDKKEETRLLNAYKKQLKKYNEVLDRMNSNIDMIQLQIDSNQRIKDNIIKRNKFISSLSRKDKKSILEHYELIKHLFDENEKIYSKIRDLEKSKKFVPSLSTFVNSHLSEEKQELFGKLIESINAEYETVKYNKKYVSTRSEKLRIEHLTEKIDFGEYNGLVDVITNQISFKESVSIPTCEVMKGEEFKKHETKTEELTR